MPARNYASTRFSELTDVNRNNVQGLNVAFTFSTGVERGHEAAPIVADGTMYIVTPFPNHVYALDLTQPGAPVKWMHDLKPSASAQGVACCDVVDRGRCWTAGGCSSTRWTRTS
jgi:glucose dehydrogenase